MKITLIDNGFGIEETKEVKDFKEISINFDYNRFSVYVDNTKINFTATTSIDFSVEISKEE